MKLLLDTQMLLWATFWPELLPPQARQAITDEDNNIFFSPVSLWETAIKSAKNRPDFQVDSRILRSQLLISDYYEIAITGLHATAVADLPPIHKDPFDRLLLAQAKVEGICLVTSDATVSKYPAPVVFIQKAH